MLKTNSKEFKEWLSDYIANNTWEPETDSFPYFKDLEGALKSLAKQWAQGGCLNDVRSCGSYQEAFIWWTQGLPNPLFDFWATGDTVALVGDALKQTKEERSRFTDTEACRLLVIKIYSLVSKYFKGFKF